MSSNRRDSGFRRNVLLVCALACLGCVMACTPDRQPAAAEQAGSVHSGLAAGGSFRMDDAAPASLLLFDEVPDSVLERRLTLHLLSSEPAGRTELSRALRLLLPERAQTDSTLVAIRAIVYRPWVRDDEAEGALAPVAWAEWIPVQGWHGKVGSGRGTGHRVYFYHGAPPEW